ncbi:hypothetical protein AgCh_010546 [Apium graveolens]
MGIHVEFEDSEVSSIYLQLAAQIDIAPLEDSIGFQFNNKGLLVQAFVHPSYSYNSGGCYQALGDLVQSCIDAILLDTGFSLNHVWKTTLTFLDPVINFSGLQLNPIRELHELCQAHNKDLEFASSEKDNTYIVEAKVNEKDVS